MWTGRRTSILRAMASFLVETYVAQGDTDRFSRSVEALRKALESMGGVDDGVRHVRSYLVPNDEMGVHVLDAATADAVKRVAKLAGIDVERIVSAIGVDQVRSDAERAGDAP